MPEHGEPDYAVVAERALFWCGLICGVAAVMAFATGDEVALRGALLRTHTDAVWVLGTLAVVLLVGAGLVTAERRWQWLSESIE